MDQNQVGKKRDAEITDLRMRSLIKRTRARTVSHQADEITIKPVAMVSKVKVISNS